MLCLLSTGNKTSMLFRHSHRSESSSQPLRKPIPHGLEDRIPLVAIAVLSRFDRSHASPAAYLKNQTAVILPPSTR